MLGLWDTEGAAAVVVVAAAARGAAKTLSVRRPVDVGSITAQRSIASRGTITVVAAREQALRAAQSVLRRGPQTHGRTAALTRSPASAPQGSSWGGKQESDGKHEGGGGNKRKKGRNGSAKEESRKRQRPKTQAEIMGAKHDLVIVPIFWKQRAPVNSSTAA